MHGGLAGAGGARGGLAGIDNLDPAAGTVATGDIIDGAVTNPKIRDAAATSVIGRSANSIGDVADITATADGQFLRRVAGALTWTASFTNVSSNHIARGSGTGELTGDAELTYDATGKQFAVSAAAAGTTLTAIYAENTSAVAGSGIRLKLQQANGGTGDLMISLNKSGGTAWTFGSDTSESGRFALNPSDGTLGTGDVFRARLRGRSGSAAPSRTRPTVQCSIETCRPRGSR